MAQDETTFADNTGLVYLFGDHPKTRIITALLSERNDVNITRLAELAGIGRQTVYRHIEDLEDIEVVTQTRTIGNSKMYEMNRNSDIVEAIGKLDAEIIGKFDELAHTESQGYDG